MNPVDSSFYFFVLEMTGLVTVGVAAILCTKTSEIARARLAGLTSGPALAHNLHVQYSADGTL